MRTRIWIALVLTWAGVQPVGAQQAYLAPAGTDISGRVAELDQALADDPDSPYLNLQLSHLHCSVGDTAPCEKYTRKVIALTPGSDTALRAHQAAMFGYYAAGYIQKAYQSAQEALALNPQAEPAVSFSAMLEAGREQLWSGKLPEKISWYGYNTANEFLLAVRTGGAGMLGIEGEGEFDCILTRSGRQICWEGVNDWTPRQNIFLNNGTRALLMYSKNDVQPIPSIGITVDAAPAGVTSPLEYAESISEIMSRNEGVTVRGPEKIRINGYDASLIWLEMPKGIRSAWYQLLLDDQIVSVQLMTTADDYQDHFVILQDYIKSTQIGAPAGPVGSLAP